MLFVIAKLNAWNACNSFGSVNGEGANASIATGGDAALAGFTITVGNNRVIGFSFLGATISSGCGILTNLNLDQNPIEFYNITFTDDTNNPFFQPTVNYFSE